MKMKFFPSAVALVILILMLNIGCSGTKSATAEDEGRSSVSIGGIENPENTMTFLDHLKRVPGVKVSGTGSDAQVIIRGINTFHGNTEPLIVLNGVVLTGGLQSAIASIPVDQIKRINVLKNGGDTAMYGSRGGNGVIEVTLKK